MKRMFKLLGNPNRTGRVMVPLLVITLILGLVLVGCPQGDDPIPASLTGRVSIDGVPHLGRTLTVNTTTLEGNGDITFQWRRGATNIGTNSSTYVVQTADIGSDITVTVTRAGHSGSVTSAPIGPVALGTVSIDGIPYVGNVLTANTVALGGSGTITFQWWRGATSVGTGSTYTVQPADVGATITVTASRAGHSVTSTPVGPTTPLPLLTGAVSIDGSPYVGRTLAVNIAALGGGDDSDDEGIVAFFDASADIAFQWRRGTSYIDAWRNGGPTLTLTPADVGSDITVTVTRARHSGSVTSTPVGPITTGPGLVGAVSITGTAEVGRTLMANTADLGGSGDMTFMWRRGTTTISGATDPVYVVQSADVGHNITVTVTRAGNSGSVTSAPTPIVPPAPPSATITGIAQVGQALTANTTLTGNVTFQWQRGTATIATSSTYVVQPADVGHTIRVNATISGSTVGTSAPTATVLPAHALTGTVSITGTAEVGQALTANTADLGGSGDMTFMWRRGTTTISGATGPVYVVQTSDRGHNITVTVTRAGNSGSVTSAPTPTVPPAPPAVTITGIAQVGQALTANTTLTGNVTFLWQRGTANIATGSTYVLQAADVGHTIRVNATISGSTVGTSAPTATVTAGPALVGTVTISGTAEIGQTLTANTADLGGSGDMTFLWRRGTTTISGATGPVYVVQAADVGHNITVTVTRAGNSGSVTSAPTPTVPPAPPAVTITGIAQVGQALTANTTLTGNVTFQWQRGTTNITFATGSTYVLQAADVGHTIRVNAISGGSTVGTSAPTASILPAHALTGTVIVTGTAEVWQALTADTADLGGSGDMTFLWRRGTTTISGATDPVYVVQAVDVGHNITVTVTRAGNSGSVTSAPTPTVPPAPPAVTITGTAKVGQRLTATTTLTGNVAFQWQRGTANIATGSTYVVQAADVGHTIRAVAVRSGFSDVFSAPTDPVPALLELTGVVTINGTAEVGQTLTANTADLEGSGYMTFLWRRGTTTISGATGPVYVVQAADVGHNITVTVTRADNSGSVISAPTPTVPPAPPAVTITGIAQVGQALTANTTLTGNVTFQWWRGTTNTWATGSTYVVQAADVGHTIRVNAMSGGSTVGTSAPTASVLPAHALTGTVSITGTAEVGQALTANTTDLGGSGDMTFLWRRGTTTISGATDPVYVIQAADVGHNITVTVTRAGNSGSVTSAPTPTVPPAPPAVTITGIAQVGQALTANTTLTGNVTFQWQRGTTNITFATGSTYVVQAADVGHTIRVNATISGSTVGTSAPTATVTAGPALVGTVTISGTAEIGQTLTANTADLGGSGDMTFLWRRGTTTISGATDPVYVIQAADVGHNITVTVTRAGNSGSVTSAPAPTVPPAPPAVTITGTAQVGQRLTATTTLTNVFTFQWQRGTSIIATGSTYVVQPADVGHTIRVNATTIGGSTVGTSAPTATVTAGPALAGTVTISGIPHVRQILTAVTTLTDVSFQWERQRTAGGTFFDPIVGETGIAYTVRLEDEGRTLRVRVTRVGYTGEVVSGSTAPVIRPTLAAETVTISGTPQVGQTLTAVTTLTDVSFHWQVLDGATWRAIPSATGAAYTVESSVNMGMGTGVINIIGRPLRVRVTRTDYLGYLIGGPTAPVSSSP